MRENFDEVISYVGSWEFFPQNGFTRGHPISSQGCQVLFEKHHNQSAIMFQLILESEEKRMALSDG